MQGEWHHTLFSFLMGVLQGTYSGQAGFIFQYKMDMIFLIEKHMVMDEIVLNLDSGMLSIRLRRFIFHVMAFCLLYRSIKNPNNQGRSCLCLLTLTRVY